MADDRSQMIQAARAFFDAHSGSCRCGGTLYFYGFGFGSEESLLGSVPNARRLRVDSDGETRGCAEVVCGYKAGFGLTAAGRLLKVNRFTRHDEAVIGWLPVWMTVE
jgi:hypothetical protein